MHRMHWCVRLPTRYSLGKKIDANVDWSKFGVKVDNVLTMIQNPGAQGCVVPTRILPPAVQNGQKVAIRPAASVAVSTLCQPQSHA